MPRFHFALLITVILDVTSLKVPLPAKSNTDLAHDATLERGAKAHLSDESQSELEFDLDQLSWDAFTGILPRNLTGYTEDEAASGRTESVSTHQDLQHSKAADFDLNAGARLAHWLAATERVTKASGMRNVSTVARGERIKVLPPACAKDVPPNDPYWSQTESYVVVKEGKRITYNECQYSNGCTKQFTNIVRLESIRGALRATKQLLNRHQMQYVLFGGSAIGAWRCWDVLPWDVDSDVLVRQEQIHVLLSLLDGCCAVGQRRSIDLAGHGLPGYALVEKTRGCQPLSIVDTSTGFFADIFPMLPVGGVVAVPFWWGKQQCDSCNLFPPCQNQGKCQNFASATTLPPAHCSMVGDPSFSCAAQLHPWLVQQFGPGVHQADRPTRPRPSVLAAQPKSLQGLGVHHHSIRPDISPHQENNSKEALLVESREVVGTFHGLLDQKHSRKFFLILVVAFLMVPLLLRCVMAPVTAQVFAVYVSLYMAWSTLTFATKDGSHNSAILVLNAIILKILLSLGLWRSWDGSSFLELPAAMWKTRNTLRQYALPAGLYALGDILRVEALRATSPGTFAVLFNSRVLFLVFAWQYWMGRRLLPIHWLSLGAILVGCFAKEAHNLHLGDQADSEKYIGYGAILVLGVCTAAAAVLNERLLQHDPEVGVNLQNLAMYCWGLVWTSIIALIWFFTQPSNTTSSLFHADAWLAIWAHPLVLGQVVILACYGVTTGYFLRYLTNIAREVALGIFAIFSVAVDFLVFGETLSLMEILGVTLVVVGIGLFAWRPVVAATVAAKTLENEEAGEKADGADNSDLESTSHGSSSRKLETPPSDSPLETTPRDSKRLSPGESSDLENVNETNVRAQ